MTDDLIIMSDKPTFANCFLIIDSSTIIVWKVPSCGRIFLNIVLFPQYFYCLCIYYFIKNDLNRCYSYSIFDFKSFAKNFMDSVCFCYGWANCKEVSYAAFHYALVLLYQHIENSSTADVLTIGVWISAQNPKEDLFCSSDLTFIGILSIYVR